MKAFRNLLGFLAPLISLVVAITLFFAGWPTWQSSAVGVVVKLGLIALAMWSHHLRMQMEARNDWHPSRPINQFMILAWFVVLGAAFVEVVWGHIQAN